MIRLFRQYFSPRKIIFVIGEGLLIFLAVTVASYLLFGRDIGLMTMLEKTWPKILLMALITQAVMYHNDLYDMSAVHGIVELSYKLLQSIGITSIMLAIIYIIWPDTIIARWVFFANLVFLLLFLICWRLIYWVVLKKRLFSEKAILVGSGELASNIIDEIERQEDLSYDIKSILAHSKDQGKEVVNTTIPIQYGFEKICELAEVYDVDSLIVALDEKRGVLPYDNLLECKIKGIKIIDGESFYERIAGKLLVEKITPSWLIFSEGFVKSRIKKFSKRAIGLVLSTLLLIITFPFLFIVALAIKIDSPGPVLFSQKRVGENERTFVLYKFRSMQEGAEKETGPVWAKENDPRVTRVGRIIRRLRIDELPQLLNIFKGDMSFVGPRPERPFFVEKLKKVIPYYKERSSVKPGVTGWAQVNYSYASSEEDALEKLKYDLYYVKNMSLVIDLMVILKTIKIVLLGRGAR